MALKAGQPHNLVACTPAPRPGVSGILTTPREGGGAAMDRESLNGIIRTKLAEIWDAERLAPGRT